jgi:hypothetical protein
MKTTDFSWLAEHGVELHNKYAGKWIAVYDGEVIAVGDTATDVAALADQKRPEGDYILQALDRSGDAIYAGL